MSRKTDAAGLVRLRQALSAVRGRDRVNLILDAPDPGALVRSLPADELFFTIEEAGLADAVPLVQLASPAQFRTFLDLDSWRKGQLEARRALPWLRAGRAGSERDEALERAWRRKLAALDLELLELVLLGAVHVHDLEQDPDPDIESEHYLRSPEGKYLVEFRVEGTEYLAIRGLLDDIYAEDPFRAARLLSALRWELPSDLEEHALRWREARLHDLGYPPLEEALSWFSRPAKPAAAAAAAMPGAPNRSPGFFLQVRPPGSVLGRASASLPDAERDALELELVAAANATMVADGVAPSDLEAVRRAVESSRALVELGLGALAGGDEARAAEVLAQTPVKALFQQGFGRLLRLRWRAEKLLPALRARGREPAPPLAEMLAALARRRPLYFPGVELAREEWGTPAAGAFQARPFLSESDLRRTEAALEAAEALLGE